MTDDTVALDPGASPDRVEKYDGASDCEYGCGDGAEFFVEMEGMVRLACHACLRENGMRPVENEWIDPSDTEGDDGR